MAAPGDASSSISLPSLDSLISYLLAAKRSLACTEQLSYANDIVTATREIFIRQSAVEARTTFLLSGCAAQLAALVRLHVYLKSILSETSQELDELVHGTEQTEKELGDILDGLRRTIVDPNLRPQNEEPKSLLDFIEVTSLQSLVEDVRTAVESHQNARAVFGDTIAEFEKEVSEVIQAISACQEDSTRKNQQSPVLLLQALESSAYDMAQNFESLVRHHDQCVTALKHTEGAGAALNQAKNNDLTDDQNASLAQELEADHDSISAGDHSHMLSLLTDDAHQVDEVIEDIHEFLMEMKNTYSCAVTFMNAVMSNYRRALDAYSRLEAFGPRLAHYTTQSHLFVIRIDDEKASIADKQAQLSDLTRFYSGFLLAYDHLIIEVGRRKDAARRMKKIQEDALTKLESLCQDDVEERDLFKTSHGEFLPVDIWPGLMTPAPRYSLSLVEGQGSVPDISASVVQKAICRVKANSPAEE